MPNIPRAAAGRRARAADFDARGQLLDAAAALFAERGVANTTVAQIAASAQVTSAMVHYWFDTRDKLLEAFVEERVAPLFHVIWDPADVDGGDPIELVQGVVRRMLDVTANKPWLPSLWMREIVNEGGQLREQALRHVPLKQVAGFGRNIARGQSRGEVNSEIEPVLLLNSVLALVMIPQATAKVWRRLNPTLTLDRAMLEQHVTGLLMHGIAPRASGPSQRARQGKARTTP